MEQEHNHYRKITRMLEDGEIKTRDIKCLAIQHDEACAIFQRGYCNCDPDVAVQPWTKEAYPLKRH